MNDNIVNINGCEIIFNGGDPLKGCPQNWEDAYRFEKNANGNKEKYVHPLWKFDCGYKLDFDGPIICVSCRFYPPKTHYGKKWDGDITFFAGDVELQAISVEVDTLCELKTAVEEHVYNMQKLLVLSAKEYFKNLYKEK